MRPTSVFVGGLNDDISKEDLEREFSKFGSLSNVWVARNPPGFAFVEFENTDDAQEAIKKMNGAVVNGSELRVDMSRGGRRGGGRGGRGGFRGGRDGGGFRRGVGGRGRGGFGRGGGRRGGSRFRGGRDDYSSGYRSRSPAGDRDNW